MILRTTCGALTLALGMGTSLAQTTTVHPGRLLASNCFQCHGTDGRPVDSIERLAGKSSRDISKKLAEMRAGDAENIMEKHARGYTDQQLRLIGDYFSTLKE